MLNRTLTWIKNNKLSTFLISVVLVFVFWPRVLGFVLSNFALTTTYERSSSSYPSGLTTSKPGLGSTGKTGTTYENIFVPPTTQAPPQTDSGDRMIVTNTTMSLLATDVESTQDKIVAETTALGGYMVSSTLTHPEEAPYATIIVRVPSDKLTLATEYFRSLGLKVPYEYVQGTDVTDKYVDITSHLEILRATKAEYEKIREKAETVEDLLKVQQHLTSLQTQIDNYVGQQRLLEQTAKLSLITINISSDELALPYAPPKGFRPSVIFKYAVRSLLGTVASLGELAIWTGVYIIIWGPILLAILWYRSRKKAQQNPPTT